MARDMMTDAPECESGTPIMGHAGFTPYPPQLFDGEAALSLLHDIDNGKGGKEMAKDSGCDSSELTAAREALASEIKRALDKCHEDYEVTLKTIDKASARLDFTLETYVPIIEDLSRALGYLML